MKRLLLALLLMIASASTVYATVEQDVATAVIREGNVLRMQRGLPPLQVDERLTQAALQHSVDMARLGYFDHQSPTPGQHTMRDRVHGQGALYLSAGENLATFSGYSLWDVPTQTVGSWMESQGHRDNLLDPRFTRSGVGVIVMGDTVLITQVFIQPLLLGALQPLGHDHQRERHQDHQR